MSQNKLKLVKISQEYTKQLENLKKEIASSAKDEVLNACVKDILNAESVEKYIEENLENAEYAAQYLGLVGEQAVGVVHLGLDAETNIAKLNYYVELKERKKGYGTEMLKLVVEQNLNYTYVTVCEKGNSVKEKTLLDAGFVLNYSTNVQDKEVNVYFLNLNNIENKNSNGKKPNEQLKEAEETIARLTKKLDSLELSHKLKDEDYKQSVQKKVVEAQTIFKQKYDELVASTEKETSEVKKYALQKYAAKLVDIVSQFNTAVNFPVQDEKIKNWLYGFQMYSQMFNDLLSQMGIVEVVVTKGSDFDPNIMEVADTVAEPNLKENTVYVVLNNAYKLHDRIIKLAMVKVVKNNA
ncbi:MAG: nucleotide exchange factor GrpE [Mycoplasmataceae bacterium]|jgi:molecular chaperone GrpE|nr:nucleotide exchange factor GrpE [Mycoplasmataceae bacterium]